jgi:hypothetical protein
MNKDIPYLRVEDLVIAIVPREEDASYTEEEEVELWDTYLINLKDEPIKSVFVSSKGYGFTDGETLKTTTLRHFFVEIAARKAVQIEPIQTKLFGLTNEYWVSFVHEDYMYDKKYIFVIGSIEPSNFTNIPLLNRKGVMIR